MGIRNEFQSQPCMTIYYTYIETLEGWSCGEVLEPVQTHLILVQKWVSIWPHLSPLMTQRQVMVTIIDNQLQSQPCQTIHYTYDETLEGSSC